MMSLRKATTKPSVAAGQRIVYAGRMGRLDDAIRDAIEASDETPYTIAEGADVARSQLSRLLSGERGLSTETIERLAGYLGLEIIIRPKRRVRKAK